MNAPTRPLPLLTAQNELYWTSGADGRLRFQRCVACRGLVHPPKPACPYCRGGATEIAEVSGEGTLSASFVPEIALDPYAYLALLRLAIQVKDEQHISSIELLQRFQIERWLAEAADKPLAIGTNIRLIEQLAVLTGRPIDLVDLQLADGLILNQVLVEGRLLFCRDRALYARLMQRMIFDQEDAMRYHRRILAVRRNAWISA